MNVYEKLQKVQAELHVPKNQRNNFGKYNYRSAEDILEALKKKLSEVGAIVTIVEEIVNTGNHDIIMSRAVFSDTESDGTIEAIAYAGVEKAGGMALPQAFGSASSYAKKYALGNLLLIDDTQDADAQNTHGKASSGVQPSVANATDKASLTPTHKNWDAVAKKVASGVSIDTIKGFYKISAATEKKLIAAAKAV